MTNIEATECPVAIQAHPDDNLEDLLARLRSPLHEVMTTQRAIRRLRTDPVPDELVEACIKLALRAPVGANAQNWEFVIVKDRHIKRQLQRMYRWQLAAYWIVMRRSYRDEAMQRNMRAAKYQLEHFDEIPVIVVACLRGLRVHLVPMPPFFQSSFYGSIYPGVQNLLLAARAMGLGASLITGPIVSTTLARRALGLPTNVTPACVIPLGFPIGRYGPTTRKPVSEVTHLDHYGRQPWSTTTSRPTSGRP